MTWFPGFDGQKREPTTTAKDDCRVLTSHAMYQEAMNDSKAKPTERELQNKNVRRRRFFVSNLQRQRCALLVLRRKTHACISQNTPAIDVDAWKGSMPTMVTLVLDNWYSPFNFGVADLFETTTSIVYCSFWSFHSVTTNEESI